MNKSTLPHSVRGTNEELEDHRQRQIVGNANRCAGITHVNDVAVRPSAIQQFDRRRVALWRPDRLIPVCCLISWEVELLAHIIIQKQLLLEFDNLPRLAPDVIEISDLITPLMGVMQNDKRPELALKSIDDCASGLNCATEHDAFPVEAFRCPNSRWSQIVIICFIHPEATTGVCPYPIDGRVKLRLFMQRLALHAERGRPAVAASCLP